MSIEQENDAPNAAEIFTAALQLPEVERLTYIEQACQGRKDVRALVLQLYAADKSPAQRMLTNVVRDGIAASMDGFRQEYIGKIVGPYRLRSLVGFGASSAVYLAERIDQYSATVAIKIVQSVRLSDELTDRFLAERQILANLDHPNIARLMDAGEAGDGNPYLVMEYVRGIPIDQHCDTHALGIDERLRLFLQVCSAVIHAHQQLVIHRDIKPDNILVTSAGAPKLLDFGIAKLLGPQHKSFTRIHDRMLTPQYASPEQIFGAPISTASDVYSLGVVLYELLTGHSPYELSDHPSTRELERIVCEQDVPRASTIVLQRAFLQNGAAYSLAQRRGTTPQKLARTLRGDLDAILSRALRKEPEHRYRSVEQLVADIERHLNYEPVSARQGNWTYVSARFLRKHRAMVGVAMGVSALLIAFVIAMAVQVKRTQSALERVTLAQQQAEQVTQFMINIFNNGSPLSASGDIPASQLLDQAVARINNELMQEPALRARLLEVMGRAYAELGIDDKSANLLEEALSIQSQNSSVLPSIQTYLTLGSARRGMGDLVGAEKTISSALQLLGRQQDTVEYALILADIGLNEILRGNGEAAIRYLEQSVDLLRKLKGERSIEVAGALAHLANARVWKDTLESAETAARESVAIWTARVPRTHPERIYAELSLAEILALQNRTSEAGSLFERILAAQRAFYGDRGWQIAYTLQGLTHIKLAEGKFDEAERDAREAFAITRKRLGPHTLWTAYIETSLGAVLTKTRKYREAESALKNALQVLHQTVAPDSQYIASAEHYMGELLLVTGRPHDAEITLRSAIARLERSKTAEWYRARSANSLGEALLDQGRIREGRKLLEESYHSLLRLRGETNIDTQTARLRLERFADSQRSFASH